MPPPADLAREIAKHRITDLSSSIIPARILTCGLTELACRAGEDVCASDADLVQATGRKRITREVAVSCHKLQSRRLKHEEQFLRKDQAHAQRFDFQSHGGRVIHAPRR